MKLYKYMIMLFVCLSIVITSNVNKSTKKKHSQQKRKELLRKVQNFSEGQKQAKQKEIIRDYTNFKKQSQNNTDDLKLQLSKNLNNLDDPKARAMASKLSKMEKTARNNDNEFLNEINKNKDEKQLSRRVETKKSLNNKRESSNLKTEELKKNIQEDITNQQLSRKQDVIKSFDGLRKNEHNALGELANNIKSKIDHYNLTSDRSIPDELHNVKSYSQLKDRAMQTQKIRRSYDSRLRHDHIDRVYQYGEENFGSDWNNLGRSTENDADSIGGYVLAWHEVHQAGGYHGDFFGIATEIYDENQELFIEGTPIYLTHVESGETQEFIYKSITSANEEVPYVYIQTSIFNSDDALYGNLPYENMKQAFSDEMPLLVGDMWGIFKPTCVDIGIGCDSGNMSVLINGFNKSVVPQYEDITLSVEFPDGQYETTLIFGFDLNDNGIWDDPDQFYDTNYHSRHIMDGDYDDENEDDGIWETTWHLEDSDGFENIDGPQYVAGLRLFVIAVDGINNAEFIDGMAYVAVEPNQESGSYINGSVYDENGDKVELSHLEVAASLYEVCDPANCNPADDCCIEGETWFNTRSAVTDANGDFKIYVHNNSDDAGNMWYLEINDNFGVAAASPDYDLIFSRDLICTTELWNGEIYEGGCFDGIFEIEGSGDVIEEVEVTIKNVPAYFEGCVRDQDDNGADSLWIEAHCYEDCGNYWDNGVSQQTDLEGCYRLPIYSTGMWRVHVNNGGAEHKYMWNYDNYQEFDVYTSGGETIWVDEFMIYSTDTQITGTLYKDGNPWTPDTLDGRESIRISAYFQEAASHTLGAEWGGINIINGEYTIPVASAANDICEWHEYWTEDGYWYEEDACGYDVVIEHWNSYDGIAPVSKTHYEGVLAPDGDIDFYFVTVTGGISGVVTDDSGQPLYDTWVGAVSLDSTDYTEWYEAQSDTSGNYTLNLPPGNYELRAEYRAWNEGDEWYDHCPFHEEVEVSDQYETVNPVIGPLEITNKISGQIINPDGTPAPYVDIFINGENDCAEDWIGDHSWSDANGYYEFMVPDGHYQLEVWKYGCEATNEFHCDWDETGEPIMCLDNWGIKQEVDVFGGAEEEKDFQMCYEEVYPFDDCLSQCGEFTQYYDADIDEVDIDDNPNFVCGVIIDTWNSGCLYECEEIEDVQEFEFLSGICEYCLEEENCEYMFDGDDEGLPMCLSECDGIDSINPSTDGNAACEWIVEKWDEESSCMEECEGEDYMDMGEMYYICSMCLEDDTCDEMFEDDDDDKDSYESDSPACLDDCIGIENVDPYDGEFDTFCDWFTTSLDDDGEDGCASDCTEEELEDYDKMLFVCEECMESDGDNILEWNVSCNDWWLRSMEDWYEDEPYCLNDCTVDGNDSLGTPIWDSGNSDTEFCTNFNVMWSDATETCTDDCGDWEYMVLALISYDCSECIENDDCEEYWEDEWEEHGTECIAECDGYDEIDMEDNPTETCEWLDSIWETGCTENCDGEEKSFISMHVSMCEDCIAENSCDDWFGNSAKQDCEESGGDWYEDEYDDYGYCEINSDNQDGCEYYEGIWNEEGWCDLLDSQVSCEEAGYMWEFNVYDGSVWCNTEDDLGEYCCNDEFMEIDECASSTEVCAIINSGELTECSNSCEDADWAAELSFINSACSACLEDDLCDDFFGDDDYDDDMYHECNWYGDDWGCNDDCECIWLEDDESYYDESDSLMYGGNCVDIDDISPPSCLSDCAGIENIDPFETDGTLFCESFTGVWDTCGADHCEDDEDAEELELMAYMCGLCLDAEYCDEWWWDTNDIGCWDFGSEDCDLHSQCQWEEYEDDYGYEDDYEYETGGPGDRKMDGQCHEGPPDCLSDDCLNAIDGMMELAPSDYCTSINNGWLEGCIADCDMGMQIDITFEIMQEQMLCEICMEEDNCDEYFHMEEDYDDGYDSHGPFDCLIDPMEYDSIMIGADTTMIFDPYETFYSEFMEDPTLACSEIIQDYDDAVGLHEFCSPEQYDELLLGVFFCEECIEMEFCDEFYHEDEDTCYDLAPEECEMDESCVWYEDGNDYDGDGQSNGWCETYYEENNCYNSYDSVDCESFEYCEWKIDEEYGDEWCEYADDGPPACLDDCAGIEALNEDEDMKEICDWITGVGDDACIEDCADDVYMDVASFAFICEECIENGNFCEQIGMDVEHDEPCNYCSGGPGCEEFGDNPQGCNESIGCWWVECEDALSFCLTGCPGSEILLSEETTQTDNCLWLSDIISDYDEDCLAGCNEDEMADIINKADYCEQCLTNENCDAFEGMHDDCYSAHSQDECDLNDYCKWMDGYDEDGNIIYEECFYVDCYGVIDGMAILDECGVCNGPGAIFECGCEEMPEEACGCMGDFGTDEDEFPEIDECGVCGGDDPVGDEDGDGNACDMDCGDQFPDCFGVCGGSAHFDNCGYCTGGTTDLIPCVTDCANIWGGEAVVDIFYFDYDQDGFGCNPEIHEGCVGQTMCSALKPDSFVDNNLDPEPSCPNPHPQTLMIDFCGVCEGDNIDVDGDGIPDGAFDCDGNCQAELDCKGVCGGGAVVDLCGVCEGDAVDINGDGQSDGNYDCLGSCIAGVDCIGVCGGDAVVDLCGNCNGGVTNPTFCTGKGCIDASACNWNSRAEVDDGSCIYAQENFTCGGICQVGTDCRGICDIALIGTGVDGIGNDECGVCGGDGALPGWTCFGECIDGLDCNGICGGSLLNRCIGGDSDNQAACETTGGYWSEAGTDECGECGGDNSSCLDCAGVPNGPSTEDLCGVCGGDNSGCVDCAGEPKGTAKLDICGVCNGVGIPEETCGCAGDFGADSLSYPVLDFCEYCGGDNVDADGDGTLDGNYDCFGSCLAELDCFGECGGGGVEDICGVCDGIGAVEADCICDDGSKMDCLGVCGGLSVKDECGICTGAGPKPGYNCQGECIAGVDCYGDCGGDALGTGVLEEGDTRIGNDECGVCGGDNSSCSGCMDEYAVNYDPTAIASDGSCKYPIYGCMNESAVNYDPEATHPSACKRPPMISIFFGEITSDSIEVLYSNQVPDVSITGYDFKISGTDWIYGALNGTLVNSGTEGVSLPEGKAIVLKKFAYDASSGADALCLQELHIVGSYSLGIMEFSKLNPVVGGCAKLISADVAAIVEGEEGSVDIPANTLSQDATISFGDMTEELPESAEQATGFEIDASEIVAFTANPPDVVLTSAITLTVNESEDDELSRGQLTSSMCMLDEGNGQWVTVDGSSCNDGSCTADVTEFGVYAVCTPQPDCIGELGGSAYTDECGECVGGTTGLLAGNALDDDTCKLCYGPGLTGWYPDADGDNLGFGTATDFCANDVPAGYVLNSSDIDDECVSNLIDGCGVCDGEGVEADGCCLNEPADCSGSCGGEATLDACNNCNGDCAADTDGFITCSTIVDNANNLIIADCSGSCGGILGLDACNNCSGDCAADTDGFITCSTIVDNANNLTIADCAGVCDGIEGSSVNICIGVEGATSQADCEDAEGYWSLDGKDQCGDCNGDGTSCLSLLYNGLIPDECALNQNYPNPFNPTTNIVIGISELSMVNVNIYDIQGRLVDKIIGNIMQPGYHQLQWSAEGVASGMYILDMRVTHLGSQQLLYKDLRKMLLMR